MTIDNIPILVPVRTILTELSIDLKSRGRSGLRLGKQTGNHIMLSCPLGLHSDKRPSAGINLDNGVFHCFACGSSYSLPRLVSVLLYDTEIRIQGETYLLEKFADFTVENRETAFKLPKREIRKPKEIQYVSEKELDRYAFYHSYILNRGISKEVVDLFDIGYDKATRCLTFPNRDVNGNTLFVARRSVVTKFFNYPRDVDKPVYGLYELHQAFIDGESKYNWLPFQLEDIVICESMIDAITCWVYGKYAVALNGLGTDSQFETLRKLPNRHFILGTDSDNAGMRARERIRKNIPNKLLSEFIFPRGVKDINELSQDQFNHLVEIY